MEPLPSQHGCATSNDGVELKANCYELLVAPALMVPYNPRFNLLPREESSTEVSRDLGHQMYFGDEV